MIDHPYKEKAIKELATKENINGPEQLVSRSEFESGKTIATCEKHGDFKVKSESLHGLTFVKSTCEECWKEYDQLVLQKANQMQEEEKQRRFIQRMEYAGVSKRHFDKSFDNYIANTKEKKYALETMKYFANKVIEGDCKNVILCGSVGTGKTHLCQATIRYIIENTERFSVQIATITEIIRYYRASWDKSTDYDETDAIENLSNKGLLIIDEMGVQNGSDSELNIIFEIINNRYESQLPTVIISNLDKGALVELLGQRIIDRLKEDGCRVLGMAWESHRETNKDEF